MLTAQLWLSESRTALNFDLASSGQRSSWFCAVRYSPLRCWTDLSRGKIILKNKFRKSFQFFLVTYLLTYFCSLSWQTGLQHWSNCTNSLLQTMVKDPHRYEFFLPLSFRPCAGWYDYSTNVPDSTEFSQTKIYEALRFLKLWMFLGAHKIKRIIFLRIYNSTRPYGI